ncbi:MAG: fimbrillin family protein [Bacteroidales bacterium]|nr:fimbrillin family protein [Bacteroidales bacterium]
MRKVLFALSLVLFVACSKQAPAGDVNEIPDEIKSITFTLTPFSIHEEGVQTKTQIQNDGSFLWSPTDTLGVYPNVGSQVYFVASNGESAKSARFDGGGWGFRSGAEYNYYSYYPFIGDIYLDRTCIPVKYTGQKQVGTTSTSHVGNYDYMWSLGDKAEGEISFSFHHLNCIIRLNATLPAGTYTKVAITAPSSVFAVLAHYDLTAVTPEIVADNQSNQIQIDLENITVADNSPFYIYIMSAPVNVASQEIVISALNSSKKEYQCRKTPSYAFGAGMICGLRCDSWTEVPQSMGLIIDDWGDGGSIGGNAD